MRGYNDLGMTNVGRIAIYFPTLQVLEHLQSLEQVVQSIVIADDAVRTLAAAREKVEVRDCRGQVLGYLPPLCTEEDIAICMQRLASDTPRYTTEQVREHLRSLEQK